MARRARQSGPGRSDATNALRQQLDRALAELRRRPPLRDAPVHEARKELKRARSTLRLLRDAIGDATYRRANTRLRDAGRPLSQLRDTRVLLDAVARLRADPRLGRRRELASLSRRLRSDRQRIRREVLNGAQGVRTVRRSLVAVRRESRAWPAPAMDSLGRGLERIYRKGRKAFARADADDDETLHESRKQAKYLSKALETLAPPEGSAMAKRAKLAESIADKLGDDHDLAVLRQKLAASRRSHSGALLSRIQSRRRKLQRKALKQGRRLYSRKARAFTSELDPGRNAR
jgi:CHAD domain-containing protein